MRHAKSSAVWAEAILEFDEDLRKRMDIIRFNEIHVSDLEKIEGLKASGKVFTPYRPLASGEHKREYIKQWHRKNKKRQLAYNQRRRSYFQRGLVPPALAHREWMLAWKNYYVQVRPDRIREAWLQSLRGEAGYDLACRHFSVLLRRREKKEDKED